MKKQLKALIYARVSTVMQEEGDSLVYQKKKCEDFCSVKGYEIYKILEDVESGANDDRSGFIELQNEIARKNFDVLVVFESSRISRKTLTMLNFVLSLEENGIKFTSISQPELDTTTPTGMLFFQIQSSLGEYERKQISSRVKSSKWQRIKDGLWQGGSIPLGYKKENDNIVVDEKGANEVKSIFFHYLSSHSLKQTSRAFNKPIGSIKWILENPFYLGKLTYGKKEKNINTGIIKINSSYHVFEGKHPPIIDEETFDTVQKILITKKRVIHSENVLLFSGLIRCTCGEKMYKNTSMNKGSIRIRYYCKNCYKTIAYKKAEDIIIKALLDMKELEEINDVVDSENKILNDKMEIYKASMKQVNDERKKYINLYSKDYITIEDLDEKMQVTKSKIDDFTDKINKLQKVIDEEKITKNYNSNLETLKAVLKDMDKSDRIDLYNMFKLLIKKIDLISSKPPEFKIYLK